MKSETYPLALPSDLLGQVREAAQEAGLSLADAMRQSLRLGLPKLRRQLSVASSVKPFTSHEAKQAFAPDPQWDEVAAAMARLPISPLDD